jgi:hypothetical protein
MLSPQGLDPIVPFCVPFCVETSLNNIPTDMTASPVGFRGKNLLAFTAERVFNVN